MTWAPRCTLSWCAQKSCIRSKRRCSTSTELRRRPSASNSSCNNDWEFRKTSLIKLLILVIFDLGVEDVVGVDLFEVALGHLDGHGLLIRLDGGQLIALLVAGVLGSPLEAVLVGLDDLLVLVEPLVLLLVARSRRRVTIAPSSF